MSEQRSLIEQAFEMFACGAMRPRPYAPAPLPQTVTVTIKPETMEILHTIALRIGTTRANVAAHIIQIGAIEAAAGCGFTTDEKERIPDSDKKWDTTQRTTGFSHIPEKEEEK